MSGFDELERQLLDAVEGRSRRRRGLPRLGAVTVALSTGMAIAIALVAVAALHHRSAPPATRAASGTAKHATVAPVISRISAKDLRLVVLTQQAVVTSDPACVRRFPFAPARLVRPDLQPPVAVAPGVSVRLIPLPRLIHPRLVAPRDLVRPAALPPRCMAEEMSRLRAAVGGLPAGARAATLALGRRLDAAAIRPSIPLIGHVRIATRVIGQPALRPAAMLEGSVPAGVATVTAQYAATPHHPAAIQSAPVIDGRFVLPLPAIDAKTLPSVIVWRAADGALVRRIVVRR